MIKLAIVGSRNFNDYEFLRNLIISHWYSKNTALDKFEVVTGGARGADSLAVRFSKQYKLPLKIFKPDWNMYGKSAGYKRNIQIVDYCDELIAFWDGNSRGTKHSIDLATKSGKPITIINI